jgi:hypothetical protein
VVRGETGTAGRGLPDAAFVVRKARKAFEAGDGYRLSVQSDTWCTDEGPGMIPEQICRNAESPHRKVRLTTAGRLDVAGIGLTLDISDGKPRRSTR